MVGINWKVAVARLVVLVAVDKIMAYIRIVRLCTLCHHNSRLVDYYENQRDDVFKQREQQNNNRKVMRDDGPVFTVCMY